NDSSITTIAHRGLMQQKEMREHVLALIYNPKSEITRI
ncbi:MAG: GTP cyclohydrolase I FolE, partial [Thaumarchaeota archaeon]